MKIETGKVYTINFKNNKTNVCVIGANASYIKFVATDGNGKINKMIPENFLGAL